MPTYEYECGKCGTLFEEVRFIDARADVECPECGAVPPDVWQVFVTPRNTYPDLEPYYDRGMGRGDGKGVHIRGRSHRREEMRRRGLVEAGDSSQEKKHKELIADMRERSRDAKRSR